jgi:cysteine desulfurase
MFASLQQPRIYLDYAATTPLDGRVREAMLPFLGEPDDGLFGNPSSVHGFGQEVRRAVDRARDTLAGTLGCQTSEVFFTSGGTEADNMALLGVLLAGRERGRDHLVTSVIEHHAVLDCARFAQETLGFAVTYVSVDGCGLVDPDDVRRALTERTALVSVMHANNEIGAIQPLAEIARVAHAGGAYFHTDAVQTFGQMSLDLNALGADLLALSAHKIYGPKGVGALYVRDGTRLSPWLHGGQQEREKRAGTENVPGIVGFGRAVELLPTWRDETAARLAALRDDFWAALRERVPDARLNGHSTRRLPNNLNVSFPGVDGESLLLALDLRGVAASSGSACASGSIEPSHVLRALGLPPASAKSAVRFSLGRGTSEDELARAADIVADCVRAARV